MGAFFLHSLISQHLIPADYFGYHPLHLPVFSAFPGVFCTPVLIGVDPPPLVTLAFSPVATKKYPTIGVAAWIQRGAGSMPDAAFRAGAQIYGMAQTQARLLAYVDVCWILVASTAILIPLPYLMRRPKKAASAPMAH